MKKILCLLIILNTYLLANEPTLKSTIDKKEVLIGESVNINFEINTSEKFNLIFPNFLDTLGHFEVISKSKIDTIKNEKNIVYKQNIKLITFDTGYYQIPSIKILYHLKNDKSKFIDYRSVSTNEYGVAVNAMKVDTTAAFKDIKPLIDAPFSIWEIIEYIYVGIGLIILLIVAYYVYKKYYKNRVVEKEELPYDPKIPADVLAIEALRKLEKDKVWQNDEFKEYYTRLTDILRIYILRVFEFEALDMTSSEIIDNIKAKSIAEELVSKLNYILTNADLVKFAKEKPYSDINIKVLENGFELIDKTKHLIKKSEEEE